MTLPLDQLTAYRRDGSVLCPAVFSFEEIAWMRDEARVVALRRGQPGRVKGTEPWAYEAPEGTIYGAHVGEASFGKLAAHPRLVEAARQIVGGEIHIHQSRLVPRLAEIPADVLWRRDFASWQALDGLAAPTAVTAAVVLGDATSRGPVLHAAAPDGTAAIAAPLGSVVFYHPELAYAFNQSGDRRSPSLFLVSYNAVVNPPQRASRPELYAAHHPVTPAVEADDCLWPTAWCAAG